MVPQTKADWRQCRIASRLLFESKVTMPVVGR